MVTVLEKSENVLPLGGTAVPRTALPSGFLLHPHPPATRPVSETGTLLLIVVPSPGTWHAGGHWGSNAAWLWSQGLQEQHPLGRSWEVVTMWDACSAVLFVFCDLSFSFLNGAMSRNHVG